MTIVLDQWQKEVLEYDGNIALRSSRQVGKSTIIAIKAAEYCIKNPDKKVMIVSAVERQAYLLFEKTHSYLIEKYRTFIKAGRDKPTKHIINLKNGSRIMCLPTGISGNNIRGFTLDMIIFDEAAFIPEEVYVSVIPSLVTTKGKIILLSTPFGREGYFYSCFSNPEFKTWHIPYTECPRINKDFIESERKRLTRMQFMQEYEGEFVDELRRFFPDSVISRCLLLEQTDSESISPHSFANNLLGDRFLGVDIARMGEDDSVFVSVVKESKDSIRMTGMEITKKTLLTETADRIKMLDSRYNYRQIYIDDAGIGAGVYDFLLKEDGVKRKIVAINNARRSLDRDEKQKKRLMKEDLYSNLLRLMESRSIKLFNNDELALSLKSIQYEYKDGKLLIFGSYSHIVEALVRAAWCSQDKHLNIWVTY